MGSANFPCLEPAPKTYGAEGAIEKKREREKKGRREEKEEKRERNKMQSLTE